MSPKRADEVTVWPRASRLVMNPRDGRLSPVSETGPHWVLNAPVAGKSRELVPPVAIALPALSTTMLLLHSCAEPASNVEYTSALKSDANLLTNTAVDGGPGSDGFGGSR